MKRKSDKSNELTGCPACGQMSFPPLFTPNEKPVDSTAKKQKLNSTTENSNEMQGDGCSSNSFNSYS